ncbi:MAG TPA: DUF4132 domain-containing protein [Tepidisphaeraceae bacterium]|jgi:hypothetical protein|nr:DUF4132 domain-containing protein [Tepidisphaeraceae bacterium]
MDWALEQLGRFGLRDDEGWVRAAAQTLGALDEPTRNLWLKLLERAQQAIPRGGATWADAQKETERLCTFSPELAETPPPEPGSDDYHTALARSAPPDAWFVEVRQIVETIGREAFAGTLGQWLAAAMKSGIGSLNRRAPNREILHALIWMSVIEPASLVIDRLQQLAVWSIAHRTAQATMIGIVLAYIASESSVGALRLIEQSSKRPLTKGRYARLATHIERRLGLSPVDSAERFVPDFGLDRDARRRIDFAGAGYGVVRVEGPDVSLRFFNTAGAELKSPSSAMKKQHATLIAAAKALHKDIRQMLSAQRNRLESLLIESRSWPLATWRARYLDHPLVGSLSRRLIWQVDDRPVLFVDDGTIDSSGQSVELSDHATIRLWHPIAARVDEVLAWREHLETLQITQPFKQAHREVYLLTDAERQTRTYSNRFAAHILRQGQFRQLAIARGWQAPLLGGWDAGDGGEAVRPLRDGLSAHFWIIGADLALEMHTPGFPYISTDQVRFHSGDAREPIPLDQVPPIVFSEVMRDVDLFVGVSSIGNDPNWTDTGPTRGYRDYWHRVSFGDLSASATTRREVLARLVPRLTIAPRCSFTERFLIVRGDLRTYKIHLGSANILMEPNDQYLCIVPNRRAPLGDSNIYLPFEGDITLSIILSKAMLLAADKKITDATITRQIAGG